jgi:hypothetical protein
VLQRLVVGAALSVCPLDDPHAPLTDVTVPPLDELPPEAASIASQTAVCPPLVPVQLQTQTTPLFVTAVAVPAIQRLVVGALLRV